MVKLLASPGKDFAGVVAAVGEGDTDFNTGQRVFGQLPKCGSLGNILLHSVRSAPFS